MPGDDQAPDGESGPAAGNQAGLPGAAERIDLIGVCFEWVVIPAGDAVIGRCVRV